LCLSSLGEVNFAYLVNLTRLILEISRKDISLIILIIGALVTQFLSSSLLCGPLFNKTYIA